MTTADAAALGAILLVSIAAQAPAASDCTPAVDADTRNAVLGKLASRLEADYAVPQTATKLAQAVRDKQKSDAYRNITCAPELARRLTEDLYAIAHDRHLRVNYSFGPVPEGPPGPPTAAEIQQMRKLNGMIPNVEILDGNVGYIRVNGVPPVAVARDAVAAAFAFVHGTDALIIDDRENHGGDPNTVALYMSYLSAGPAYVVNTFHWRTGLIEQFRTTDLGELGYGASKPVFVLTSPETFSGGEELAYDLQTFKRGMVVGEVTGGGANPGGPESLGHQFVVNMPSGQAVNPVTGGSWEGVGVRPDVAVPAPQALSNAHRLAVQRLLDETRDPVPRSLLEAVAMKLESLAQAESGEVVRIANAQLIGTYVLLAGQGAAVTIQDKDGRLVQRVGGFPDVRLILIGGNRYRLEGSPEGSFTSFRLKDGKVQLLREAPGALPRMREKQAASP
jgi:hypothetical protein